MLCTMWHSEGIFESTWLLCSELRACTPTCIGIYILRDCVSVIRVKLLSYRTLSYPILSYTIHGNGTQSHLQRSVQRVSWGTTRGDIFRDRSRGCSHGNFTFKSLSALLHLACDVPEGFADPLPAGSQGTLNPGSLGDACFYLYLGGLLHGVQILSRDKRRARSSHILRLSHWGVTCLLGDKLRFSLGI